MARKKQAPASPPPTGRDEWLETVSEACSFGDAVVYTGSLESHGLDSLDAFELCLWLEERYNIDYERKATAGFTQKTLWEIRCEAEELAARAKKR